VDADEQRVAPFVKWAGGKTSLLPHLFPHVPLRLSNYFEPFLGGGALFFGICSRTTSFNAHLSDTNNELVNAYSVIKESPEELIRLLSSFQREYDSEVDKSAYFYRKREWRPTDPIESAARLIFLNKTCYNGLYRVNSKGEFNVPFGRYKKPRIINSEGIRSASHALAVTKAELRTTGYKDAVASCRAGDFVYLDPPYQPPSKTSSFTDYTPDGFSEKDQEELAEEFGKLVDRGCTVLLSNSDTALTRKLYRDFETKKVTANRPINSVGAGRKGYKELIVLGRPRQNLS
jgi:DNA adenine methylase